MKRCAARAACWPQVRRSFNLAVLAGWLLSTAAAAQQFGPDAALAFQSGQPETARALEQAIRAGDPWELLDWTFTLRPSVLYRQYLDERGGDLLNPRLSTTLQVRFGERPLDTVRRATRLERALRAHDRALRLETRNALLAFGELLIAQDAYRAAALGVQELDPEATSTARQAAELNLRNAETSLQAARREASAFGLHGEAVYGSLRFRIPESPRVTDLSAYRLQELALAEAETRFVEAGGRSILRDLRLGVGYRTDGIQVDLEAGLLAGRSGLRLGTIHPGGRARMEVRVSAELAIGGGIRDLPTLLEDVQLTGAELDRLGDELWADWLAAALDAELAEEALNLEEAFLAEAELALLEAQESLRSLPATADEREVARQQTSVERAEREVQRLTTRVQRAWISYVRRQHDLLEAAEGRWAAR